ncbi:MAG TPA: hypothetical protein VMT76_11260 [Puia sp.]|nr:hypothetical protein [Puia sp.]
MKKYFFFLFFFFIEGLQTLLSQSGGPNIDNKKFIASQWSVANAHSHNDYQQKKPFTLAYDNLFGSMEADIFLVRDSLFVGHEESDVLRHRLLTDLYLDSLKKYIRENNGYPYRDKSKQLQLLIDLKTGGEPTLAALIRVLQSYPEIIHCKSLSIVITGNKPPVDQWLEYPSYIYFDGNCNENYPASLLPKIRMLSGDLAELTKWDGRSVMNDSDSVKLAETINKAHAEGKKIRFWGAPDFPKAWLQLIKLGADWINTDHIPELAKFLEKSRN